MILPAVTGTDFSAYHAKEPVPVLFNYPTLRFKSL